MITQYSYSCSTNLWKKLGLGLLGAAYVCMLLLTLLIASAAVGFGLVQFWVEEPVFVRERLYFDYTQAHPKAVFSLANDAGPVLVDGYQVSITSNIYNKGIPVGHTFHVSLALLMPESDYNSEIGVFQLSAEILSANGQVLAKSSQPCMLRFRSFPIRLARTFMMGIPLLLGISGETQKINIQIMKHKEGINPRTKAIRFTLSPRAGTWSLPQIYEAEIVMNSRLPWAKQLVHNWKWTFCVWTSLYLYTLFLIFLLCFCRPIIFPFLLPPSETCSGSTSSDLQGTCSSEQADQPALTGNAAGPGAGDEETEVSELLRKWRRCRSKRKAIFLHSSVPMGSSASTARQLGETTSAAAAEDDDDEDEEVGDSESVCLA